MVCPSLPTFAASCPVPAAIHLKVFKGVVYADHDHHKDGRYMSYRQAFLEQLVLAVWLYSDFPDVDLIVDYTGVGECVWGGGVCFEGECV